MNTTTTTTAPTAPCDVCGEQATELWQARTSGTWCDACGDCLLVLQRVAHERAGLTMPEGVRKR